MEKTVVEFAIANMDEFNELVEKGKRQASDIKKTIDEINSFKPEISFQRQQASNDLLEEDLKRIRAGIINV